MFNSTSLAGRAAVPVSWGDILVSLSTHHFVATEAAYAAGTAIAPHVHSNPTLNLTIAGRYCERVERSDFECDENLISIKTAHTLHTNSFPVDSKVVLFEPVSEQMLAEIAGVFGQTQHVRSRVVRPIALRIWSELHSRDAVAALAIDAKLFELIAELTRSRHYSASSSRLRKCLDIIHDSATADSLDVNILAGVTGLPVRSFLRQFTNEMGCSLPMYIRRSRVDRAKRLLLETDTDLRSLALDLGYYDQSHFANTFRKHVGLTPSEYRRNPA